MQSRAERRIHCKAWLSRTSISLRRGVNTNTARFFNIFLAGSCRRMGYIRRRECLDHFLVFGERHLMHMPKAYLVFFNHARPHQGLGQRIPVPLPDENEPNRGIGRVRSIPILGGLHHRYQLAA